MNSEDSQRPIESIYEKKLKREARFQGAAQDDSSPKKNTLKNSEKETRSHEPHSSNGILSVLFLGFILILPFFFQALPGFPPAISKLFFLEAAVLSLAVIWVGICFWTGKMTVAKTWIWPALLLFLLASFLSSFTLSSPVASVFGTEITIGGFLAVLSLVLLAFISANVFTASKNLRFFFFFYFVIHAGVLFFHIGRTLFGNDFLGFGYFTESYQSVLGQWFDLPLFFGLSIVVALSSYFFLWKSYIMRVFALAVFATALVALTVFSVNIVFGLLLAFSLVLFVVFSLEKGAKQAAFTDTNNPEQKRFSAFQKMKPKNIQVSRSLKKTKILLPSILFVFSLVFLLFGSFVSQNVAQMSGVGSTAEVRPTWNMSWNIYQETSGEDLSTFVFGSGPESFEKQWAKYKPAQINQTQFWNVDFSAGASTFLTFAVLYGLVGVVAMMLLLLVLLYESLRAYVAVRVSKSEDEKNGFLLVLLPLWFLVGLFLFYASGAVLLVFLFVFLGMFVGVFARAGVGQSATFLVAGKHRVVSIAGVSLILLFLGSIVGLYFTVERYYAAELSREGVILLSNGGDLSEAKEKMTRATELHPKDLYYRNLSEIGVEEMRAFESNANENVEELQRVFQQAIADGKRAYELDPENYKNTLFLANLYRFFATLGVEGSYEQAKNYYEETRVLAPNLPSVDLFEARLEIASGNTESAEALIEEALAQRPDYLEASLLKARILLEQERNAAATDALVNISQNISNDARQWYQVGNLFYQAGDYENAVTALSNALTLVPSYADAKYYLGLSYRELGRTDEAIRIFEELEGENVGNQDVGQILERLRAQ